MLSVKSSLQHWQHVGMSAWRWQSNWWQSIFHCRRFNQNRTYLIGALRPQTFQYHLNIVLTGSLLFRHVWPVVRNFPSPSPAECAPDVIRQRHLNPGRDSPKSAKIWFDSRFVHKVLDYLYFYFMLGFKIHLISIQRNLAVGGDSLDSLERDLCRFVKFRALTLVMLSF